MSLRASTPVPPPAVRPRHARDFGAGAALCAAMLAGACGGDAGTEPNGPAPGAPGAPVTAAAVAGRYTLVAHGGRALPTVVTERPGEFRAELLGGTLELGVDRSFGIERRFRETNLRSGQVATSTAWARGQFTIHGRVLRFDDIGDPSGTDATVSGDTLTYGPFTFRR